MCVRTFVYATFASLHPNCGYSYAVAVINKRIFFTGDHYFQLLLMLLLYIAEYTYTHADIYSLLVHTTHSLP